MDVTHAPLPAVDRGDAAAIAVTEWTVSMPERQLAVQNAIAAAWRDAEPPAGMLAQTLLASSEGTSLLYYSQWASDKACDGAIAAGGPAWMDQVTASVDGLQRDALVRYARYRSDIPASGDPGCIVAVRVTCEKGDAHDWVDAMLALGQAHPDPVPGLLAAHFHVSDDGRHVLNYAEWTDEAAHIRVMEGAPGNGHERKPTTEEERVYSWPGMAGLTVTRYRPAATQVIRPAE